MRERLSSKHGGFYGCQRFPLCLGTRPSGPGPNSYTNLLRAAYAKALVFLSGPNLLGVSAATMWLASKALDLEDGETVVELPSPNELTNGALEKAIDAAVSYVSSKGLDQDFLVLAHAERADRVKWRYRANLNAERIRDMVKPAIVRRYDEGVFLQMEAAVTTEWNNEGMHCPRCGNWAEKGRIKFVDGLIIDDDMLSFIGFTCAECGQFKKRNKVYVFSNDVGEPGVVLGIALDMPEKSPLHQLVEVLDEGEKG